MSKSSGSMPQPDPNIGLAALKSAQTGEDWLNVAKQQYSIANARQDKLDDLNARVTTSQLAAQDQANTWAAQDRERYTSVFQPLESQFVATAGAWNSAAHQAEVAGSAKADVLNAAATAEQTRQRQMSALGVNPASGRFAGLSAAADTATALASAGAQTNARRQLENQALSLQGDAVSMGKGLPSQAAQALGLGVNSGNATISNAIGVNNAWLGNTDLLKSGYQTAMTGYGQQATILNNLYNNQIDAWKAQEESKYNGLKAVTGIIGAFRPFK